MIRIILLLIVLIWVFWGLRWLLKTPPQQIAQSFKRVGWLVVATLVLVLLLTGKLNALFAALGVGLAFLLRLAPVLLNYGSQLERLWLLFTQRSGRSGQSEAQQPPAASGAMTKAQAYQVLGLQPGATDAQIIDAHRRLMLKYHPDRGGSDYLAAQINQAKKVLLG